LFSFLLLNYFIALASSVKITPSAYAPASGYPMLRSPTVPALPIRATISAVFCAPSTAVIDTILKNGAGRFASSNPVLQPAFDYIFTHKHENFSLKEMAKLCHISPSYFSRIFTKETGENFSVFIARHKIEWAKRLLESTDSPIHQVSDDLGFCDTGYFIKTFKKFENLTPAVYRNMYAGISAK